MVTLFDYQVNAIKSWMEAKSMGIEDDSFIT
jgi:hypothetical protein